MPGCRTWDISIVVFLLLVLAMTMLNQTFTELVSRYTDDKKMAETLWDEIFNRYAERHRHYHNLSHVESMVSILCNVKSEIQDWDTLLFAVFYHDIIYKPTSPKNEEKSADLASQRLAALSYPSEKRQKCSSMILATKRYSTTGDRDTDYLVDADLFILGQDEGSYTRYGSKIRQEYTIYPDFIYNRGRKKVLLHFLAMNPIFKTKYFFDNFESKAKQNLQNELSTL